MDHLDFRHVLLPRCAKGEGIARTITEASPCHTFLRQYTVGVHVIVEANEGFLLGGRTVDSGPVFERFFDALSYMNRRDRKQRGGVPQGEAWQSRAVSREGVYGCVCTCSS